MFHLRRQQNILFEFSTPIQSQFLDVEFENLHQLKIPKNWKSKFAQFQFISEYYDIIFWAEKNEIFWLNLHLISCPSIRDSIWSKAGFSSSKTRYLWLRDFSWLIAVISICSKSDRVCFRSYSTPFQLILNVSGFKESQNTINDNASDIFSSNSSELKLFDSFKIHHVVSSRSRSYVKCPHS